MTLSRVQLRLGAKHGGTPAIGQRPEATAQGTPQYSIDRVFPARSRSRSRSHRPAPAPASPSRLWRVVFLPGVFLRRANAARTASTTRLLGRQSGWPRPLAEGREPPFNGGSVHRLLACEITHARIGDTRRALTLLIQRVVDTIQMNATKSSFAGSRLAQSPRTSRCNAARSSLVVRAGRIVRCRIVHIRCLNAKLHAHWALHRTAATWAVFSNFQPHAEPRPLDRSSPRPLTAPSRCSIARRDPERTGSTSR